MQVSTCLWCWLLSGQSSAPSKQCTKHARLMGLTESMLVCLQQARIDRTLYSRWDMPAELHGMQRAYIINVSSCVKGTLQARGVCNAMLPDQRWNGQG